MITKEDLLKIINEAGAEPKKLQLIGSKWQIEIYKKLYGNSVEYIETEESVW